MSQPVLLMPPSVALTPNKLPKYHPLWQALLPRTCYQSRKQYPAFARCRLCAIGSCVGKRVEEQQGVVVALPFPPSEYHMPSKHHITRSSLQESGNSVRSYA